MNGDFFSYVKEIKPINEEIKHFVMEKKSYYGVTRRGFLFNINKCYSIQGEIENMDDYYTYLWAHCVEGLFLCRQRFIYWTPKDWNLIAKIIPTDDSLEAFEKMSDLLKEDASIADKICQSALS